MKVQLTRKLADRLDGIDLSAYSEGDVVHLPERQAQLLIAEGWAVPVARFRRPPGPSRYVDAGSSTES